jgi:hypothetical protein
MKIFHCDHCDNLVFFENVQCVACQHQLAYLPDLGVIGSLDRGEDGLWRSPLARAQGKAYRFCRNYSEHGACNWATDAENLYCLSCRLNRVIPDLSKPGNKEAWYKVEVAKRRLIYSLLSLKLPLESKIEKPETGLAFEILADPEEGPKVLTGHDNGLITINLAEADDAEREKRRHQMHEPYRTLLGHFRHEVGHYYWDRLVKNGSRLNDFRALFGDERDDYAQALQRHYKDGAPPDWQERFISAYASAHPWEDWAETWAQYLHMADALEVAAASGLSLRPKRAGEPVLRPVRARSAFETMIESWPALTYLMNNLNRGMGLTDAYPFVLSAPAIEKLHFVHDVIAAAKVDDSSAPARRVSEGSLASASG